MRPHDTRRPAPDHCCARAAPALPSAGCQAEKARQERTAKRWAERTIDAQRASAPVPRDTVQVYKQLADAGLEYGPAFRLLRNVHVPLPAEASVARGGR